jgi:hypothetical protein
MPAIEITNVMNDQKMAGANAAILGRMNTGSSKNDSPNDFLGMMQMTMAKYQRQNSNQVSNQEPNQNHIEENIAAGSDDSRKDKTVSIKNQHPAQGNGKSKKAADNDSPGETATKPADENTTDEQTENIGAPVFIAAVNMDKMIPRSTEAGMVEKGTEALLALQKEGKRELDSLNGVLLNANADKLGKQHKENLSSLVKKDNSPTEPNLNTITEKENQSLTEANPNTIPEIKNQLVKVMEAKGISSEEIEGILKAIEDISVKFGPADRSLRTNTAPEIKNQSVKAPAGKGIRADVIEDIQKTVAQLPDEVIVSEAPDAPEVNIKTTGKFPSQVEATAPSFKQAAVAILEKKGFSPEEIKGIMNTVDQATVGGAKPDAKQISDQSVFIQQSLYHKEFIKEATVGRNNIHDDIYQKEASLENFSKKNVEAQLKINPLEKQTVKDGHQRELSEQPENTGRADKKNVFSGTMRETENKKAILNDKEIAPQTTEKVITATENDDLGQLTKLAGDMNGKKTHKSQEDIILTVGREQSPMPADTLGVETKGADVHYGKTTVDTSKSIYQSVVDQIQDSFSLVQSKESGQVRVSLKPEIMGHLDMDIAVHNDTVQIMMTVENEKVHQAMNAHIDDLKTALQNQGLKIDKIEVTLQYQPDQERPFYQDQANSGFNNPGQDTRHERMLNQELHLGDEHYPKSGQEIMQKQNSMEGVSIFA